MARPFAVIGLTFLAALWVWGNLGETAAIAGAAAFAVLLVLCLSVRPLRKAAVYPCACAAVLASCVAFITAAETTVKPVQQLDGKTVTVTAHMTDLPQKAGAYTLYIVQTDTVNGRPMSFPMHVFSENEDGYFSDVLAFRSKVFVNGTAKAYPRNSLQWIRQNETLQSRMLRIRQYTQDTVTQAVPGTPGAVLKALLTGDTDSIPGETFSYMRACGILHIFSVSGFHLSVFSFALLSVLDKCKVHRVLSSVSAAVLVLFVTLATGCSKPTVRAAVMLLVMLLGRCFFRRADALNSLGLSVLLLGMADPLCASDAGLLLSVLGVLGVILSSGFAEKISEKVPFRPLRTFASVLLVSACIHLVTLPVQVLSFGTVSLTSPLANAFLLPAAQGAMVLAALSTLLSLWHPLLFLQKAVFLVAGLLAKYCAAVADFFGALPFSALEIHDGAAEIWVAGVLGLLAVSLLLTMQMRRKILFTASAAVGALALSAVFCLYSESGNVRITVLDAGNATSVLLQSDGESALIGTANVYRLQKYTDTLQLLLIPRLQPTESADAVHIVRKIPTDQVVVPERAVQTLPLFLESKPMVTTAFRQTVGHVQLEFFYKPDASAMRLTMYGKRMLLLFAPGEDVQKLPMSRLPCDILYSRSDLPQGIAAEDFGLAIVSCDADRGAVLPKSKNILFTAGRGDICLTVSREGLIHIERSAENA